MAEARNEAMATRGAVVFSQPKKLGALSLLQRAMLRWETKLASTVDAEVVDSEVREREG